MNPLSSRHHRLAPLQDALFAIGVTLVAVPSVIAAIWLVWAWLGVGGP